MKRTAAKKVTKKLPSRAEPTLKRAKTADSESDSESDLSSSSSLSSSDGDLVDRTTEKDRDVAVEFETRDPSERDWHAIKRAIGNMFDRGDVSQFDSAGLTDVVLGQTDFVGSVLQALQGGGDSDSDSDSGTRDGNASSSASKQKKQKNKKKGEKKDVTTKGSASGYDAVADVEPQVVGVLSLVNVQKHIEKPFIQQLKDLLASKLKKKAAKQRKRGGKADDGETPAAAALDTVQKLFNGEHASSSTAPRLGWWISERLMNVPPEIAPPLHESLQTEIGWAIDYSHPERSEYNCDTFLKIVCTYTSGDNSTRLFVHPEDEVFHKHAVVAVSWPLQDGQDGGRWTLDSPNTAMRRWVLLFPSKSLGKIITDMNTLLPPTQGTVRGAWE